MADIKTRLKECERASKEILDYIEELLSDVRLEIPVAHQPIRRSLMWYAPTESDFATVITFKIYKRAIEDINKEQRIAEQPQFKSDSENDGFAHQVQELMNSGFSEDDAINGLSGSANLDSLAEGMVPGFISLIERLFTDLPGLDGLKSEADPISSYMSSGSPNQFTDELKLDLKSSVGIETAKKREKDTAAAKIVRYAMSAGIAKTSEYSPAKIWHAWVLYPRLKGIHLKSQSFGTNVVSVEDPVNYAGYTTDHLYGANIDWFEREIREAATILSSKLSNSVICCFLSSHVNIEISKELFTGYRAILNTAKSINSNVLQFTTPDYTEAINAAKDAAICNTFYQLDTHFNKSVKFLRESFNKLEEKIGGDVQKCGLLDMLFDGMIGILNDLRSRGAKMLRGLLSKLELKRQQATFVNNVLMENMHISRMLGLFDEIERLIDTAHSCGLSKEARDRQAIDLMNRLGQEGKGLKVHIKGQPLPDGLSPDSPLANLEPIKTIHGFTVNPGIQSENLPTGELEELFKGCSTNQLQDTTFTKVKAEIRRK